MGNFFNLARYGADFTPKNNRKWTRGRNFRYVTDKDGKTVKEWNNKG